MHLFNLCFATSVLFTACALPLPTRCCWPDLRARDDVVSNTPPLKVEFHTGVPDEIREDIAAQVVAQHRALQFETAGPAQQAKKATFAKVQKGWPHKKGRAEFYFHDGYPNDNNRIGPMRTVTPLSVNLSRVPDEQKVVIDREVRLNQARFSVGHRVRSARAAGVGEGWHISPNDPQMHVRVEYHSLACRGRDLIGTAHIYEPGKPGPAETGDGRKAANNYYIPKGTWKVQYPKIASPSPPKITTPVKPELLLEPGKPGPAPAASNYYVPGGARKVQYPKTARPSHPKTVLPVGVGKPDPAGTGDGRKAPSPSHPKIMTPVKPELQGKKLSYLQAAKNG